MCAALRVVDDRRQGAVEVEADDRPAGDAHELVVPPLPVGGGELHEPTQPPERPPRGAGRRNVANRSVERVGQDQREPVPAHRVDGGRGTPDAEVERQRLGRPLEPLRVVDRRRRHGAVPVVGPDDLPADVGGTVGDLARQTGDAGVVVDLDVDLAALDGGLGRLRLRLRARAVRRRGRLRRLPLWRRWW